jgi:hypothetical protein
MIFAARTVVCLSYTGVHARGDRKPNLIIVSLSVQRMQRDSTAQPSSSKHELSERLSRTVRCAHKPSATRRSRAAGGYLWHALARDQLIILCSAECDREPYEYVTKGVFVSHLNYII